MTQDCQRIHAIADELALGHLTGLDRALALAHLDECHGCRTEIATLAEAADSVLLVAPSTPPDPGFERRVRDRISQASGGDQLVDVSAARVIRPHRRRRVRMALAAAAVIVAALCGSLLWATQRAPNAVAATMVDGRGDRLGRVTLVADQGTAVQMDLPGWSNLLSQYGNASGGQYWLEVTLDDGSQVRSVLPPGDAGRWHMPIAAGRSRIVAVAVTGSDGQRWCHADFT